MQTTSNTYFEPLIFTKGNSSFFLNAHGKLYVWGDNSYGELGLGDTNTRLTPTLLTLPNNEKISFLNCGYNHTICLTERKLCYVWGSNHNGSLGLGDTNIRIKPTLLTLPNGEMISTINSGYYHTVCLTENNLCYVWGYNNSGQLGLGDKNNRYTPTLLTLPNNERIALMFPNTYNNMCLTENNLCYVWGDNKVGELGLGHRANCYIPTLFSFSDPNEKIYFKRCGYRHAVSLTESNLCYVWGDNVNGQLGLGDNENRYTPTLLALPNNEKICFVSCGQSHTVCLTQTNLCYVWGANSTSELGLGDRIDRLTPTLLTLPNYERISFITCGAFHTICLTENNLCYVWGNNQFGQLGLGDTKNAAKPTLLILQF